MKRRTLLAGIPPVASGFSGCLSGRANEQSDSQSADEEINYEKCTEYIIRNLPSAAENELRAAIEDGVYETDGELILTKVVNIDQSYFEDYVDSEHIYYEATVETEDGSTRLFVENIVPKYRGEGIELDNQTEKDLTVDIRIEYEGELFLEESIDIRAGEKIEVEGDSEFLFGEYFAEVNVPNEEKLPKTDHTWEIHDYYTHPSIHLAIGNTDDPSDDDDPPVEGKRFRDDGIHFYDYNNEINPGVPCAWNDNGKLLR